MRTNKRLRNKTEPRPGTDKKGFMLPLAGTMIVLLTVTGLGLLRVGLSARVQAAKTTAELAARAAADAGFTKAMHELNRAAGLEPSKGGPSSSWIGSLSTNQLFDLLSSNNDWTVTWGNERIISSGNVTFPVANADYNFNIQEIVRDSLYKVTSTGRSGWAQKTVSLTVRRQGIFDYGVYAVGYAKPKKSDGWFAGRKPPGKKGGRVKIKGYNVDNYSSDPGVEPRGRAKVGTNSRHKDVIKLEKDIVINGDVAVGPGANPRKSIKRSSGSYITGDAYASAEISVPPAVIVPDNLLNGRQSKASDFTTSSNEKDKDKNKNKQILSGNLTFDEFKVEGDDKVVTVHSNCTMYVEGDMKIKDGAQLVIAKNSSLTLYVGGKLEMKSHPDEPPALVNETQDPTSFIVYGTDTCEKVKFERVDDFYGGIYAPFAKVEVKKSDDVYGALVGWDVKLERDKKDDNQNFYFDEALSNGGGTARYARVVWSEQ